MFYISLDASDLIDFPRCFREDIWGAVQILHDRLVRMDHAKVIACDMVTKITNHFEKVRFATVLV